MQYKKLSDYAWSTIAKKPKDVGKTTLHVAGHLNAFAMVNHFICKMLYFELTCTQCTQGEHLRNDIIQINVSVKTSHEYFTKLHISYSLAPSLSFQSMTNSGLQEDILKSYCEKLQALLENSLVKPNCALVVFCNLHREDKRGQ